ncbi:MAG: cystathionine beta-synthase [Deltaproteobacteria bacterium]|nr:cystathionine beta-synthase [Deltaproteobacteria bacterium]
MNRPVSGGVLGLIGNTPLVKVQRIDTGPCELFLKLENQNPGGSIKDRIGLSMIEAAEKEGKLKPGGTIIEATAGNTGLALALVAASKGYKMLVVIPDKMSQEKVFHLKALGAEIVMTRSDVAKGHPDYYQDVAARIAKETPNSHYVNQFNNQANPQAHEESTGPEIFEQMDKKIDAMVCGVGSGGTLTGLSKFFKKAAPECEMVLADPKGSILAHYIKTGEMIDAGSWLVEGIGEDFIPAICDLSRVKQAYTITDEEAFTAARELLAKEGILGGSSSGTLLAAALKYCREQKTKKRVVTLVCDTGGKYLSKMFNDYWMQDQGFIKVERYGDLRDIITRPASQRAVVSVKPTDTLLRANALMKLYDVSQLPVLEGDKIVGIIDESDILFAVYGDQARFKNEVKGYMSTRLKTLEPKTPIEQLMPIFSAGMVAIVTEGERFFGLITRSDVLNYLRRTQK